MKILRLAAEGRSNIRSDVTSSHDGLYGEHGLPK